MSRTITQCFSKWLAVILSVVGIAIPLSVSAGEDVLRMLVWEGKKNYESLEAAKEAFSEYPNNCPSGSWSRPCHFVVAVAGIP